MGYLPQDGHLRLRLSVVEPVWDAVPRRAPPGEHLKQHHRRLGRRQQQATQHLLVNAPHPRGIRVLQAKQDDGA